MSLHEIQQIHKMNDIQSDSYTVSKVITFRSNNNKLLNILMVGIVGTIVTICISLAPTTTTSIHKSNLNRHLLANVNGTQQSHDIQDPLSADTLELPNVDSSEMLEQSIRESSSSTDIINNVLSQVQINTRNDRVLGLFVGAAFGDILGVPLEFFFGTGFLLKGNSSDKLQFRKIGGEYFQVYEDKDNNTKCAKVETNFERAVDLVMNTMAGGGFFRTPSGLSSDDTAMAMQMARSFIAVNDDAKSKEHSISKILQSNLFYYQQWANPNPLKFPDLLDPQQRVVRNRPFDIGLTIRKVLISSEAVDEKLVTPQEVEENLLTAEQVVNITAKLNKQTAEKYGNGLWSNGALMRAAPLAVYCLNLQPDDVYAVVEADMALTNNNPLVTMVTTTYVLIIRELINGSPPTDALGFAKGYLERRRDSVDPVENEDTMGYTKPADGEEKQKIFMKPSVKVLEWMDQAVVALYPGDAEPFATVETGFKQAVYFLNQVISNGNSLDLAKIIKAVILSKGDTDTNALIVAGMLGAYYGIHGLKNLDKFYLYMEKMLDCKVEEVRAVLDTDTVKPTGKLDADHTPYLAKHWIKQNIWKKLIKAAPTSIVA